MTALTHEMRETIRYMRNLAVRESLMGTHERTGHREAIDAEAMATIINARGIPAVDAREVRVNERGASGIAGVRGAASLVSQRDAHVPTTLLRGLSTVGVATHPYATQAEVAAALMACRRNPSLCTVRVINAAGSRIVPVSDYVAIRRERRAASRSNASTASRASADIALMASMGSELALADGTA